VKMATGVGRLGMDFYRDRPAQAETGAIRAPKSGVALCVNEASQPKPITESLINRQSSTNSSLNSIHERMANLADRLLSAQPTAVDNMKDPGPPGGAIGNIEWLMMQTEYIVVRIMEQVSRLESL
jgi:hypothetical protein